jgi:DNA-binding transcriptional LysR family regulator
MDYNKLKTFTLVAELGSISQAAYRLYRTQPAISTQLKDLESELNLILFERRNARIFLTHEGRRLYEHAKQLLDEIDDGIDRLRNDPQTAEGLIRIAATEGVSYLLPRMIAEFRKEYPGARFEIVSSQFVHIDHLLINNDVDFALGILFEQDEFLETEPFYSIQRTLMASEDFIQQEAGIHQVEDLVKVNLVGFFSPLGDFRFWLKKNGQSQWTSQFERTAKVIVTDNAYTLNELVFNGVAAGFVFDDMAGQRSHKNQRLVPLLPHMDALIGTVDLAQKKVRNPSFLKEAFRQFVLDHKKLWKNW